LNVLQAKGASDPALSASVVDNGTSYTVTLSHPIKGASTVTLQKGRSSSGGSVSIAGQAYSFIAGVQNISVTDAGPSWGGGSPSPPAGASIAAPTGLRIVR
jgi:hypothetical protein